jgi:hypothetical protein
MIIEQPNLDYVADGAEEPVNRTDPGTSEGVMAATSGSVGQQDTLQCP